MPYESIKHFKNIPVLDFDVIMTVLESFVICTLLLYGRLQDKPLDSSILSIYMFPVSAVLLCSSAFFLPFTSDSEICILWLW